MAKARPKPESPFTGLWRIVSMSAWDKEFIDEEEQLLGHDRRGEPVPEECPLQGVGG